MATKNRINLLIVLFTMIIIVSLRADDHVVQEFTRTYMGRTIPARTNETWIGEDKYYHKSGNFITITRYDLNKKWIIFPRQKRYLEEPIEKKISNEKEEPSRIQELGFNYQPEFDWIVRQTEDERIIDGKTCRCTIFEGDADYAEETREYWLTEDLPIDLERYHQVLIDPIEDKYWAAYYQAFPIEKYALPLETKIITENAIAPTMTWNFEMIRVETAEPPDNIYEIPEGYARVNTREELYAR